MNNTPEDPERGHSLDFVRGCIVATGLMLPFWLVVGAVIYWIIAGGRP